MKRILMLHGYGQSDIIFRAKTGGLRKLFAKSGYELYYPRGPCALDCKSFGSESSDQQPKGDIYGWFIKEPDTLNYTLNNELLAYLREYITDNGPFVGVIGFSQGAGLAGYLLTDLNKLLSLSEKTQPKLNFAIFFSGFRMEPSEFQYQYDENPISIRSLHVLGELDTLVTEQRSMELYHVCLPSTRTLLKHSGGHYIPNQKNFLSTILNWTLEEPTQSDLITNPSKDRNLDTNSELDPDLLDIIDSLGKI